MNILYFCNVNRSIPLEAGVYKKILAQCQVLRQDGHKVLLACTDGYDSFVIIDENETFLLRIDLKGKNSIKRDKLIYLYVEKFIRENLVDIVYSRFGKYNIRTSLFYSRIKKAGVDVLLEIPTYPFSQRWTSLLQSLKLGYVKSFLMQLYNVTVGSLGIPLLKKNITYIVNNNDYDEIWGIPVLKIHNGIDVKSVTTRCHTYEEKKTIRIMTVANVANWHGFDRLINGLYYYYQSQPTTKVYFDIVGPGAEVKALQELTYKRNLNDYVCFYGTVVGEKLDKLFDKADIGVSILGIHRNNMKVIDCLKSREFCARKLPFVTQEAESHFCGKSFALTVPSNESPIDINRIVEFYQSIVDNNNILDEMYSFAVNECDWSKTFISVREYLLSKGKQ